ncbi:hypothetical protein Tco_1211762 [Tanacetum coccineum]
MVLRSGLCLAANAVQQVGCSFQTFIFEELDSLRVRLVPSKLVEFLKEIQTKYRETVVLMILRLIIYFLRVEFLFARVKQIKYGYLYVNSDVLSHIILTSIDKMKFWFTRAHTKDEGLVRVLHDLSFEIRIIMHKSRRLLAELEALGERGDVVKILKAMREIVARDSTKLAILEQLLVGTHVAIRLK